MDMYYRPYMESKPFPNSAHPSCSKVQWYATKKIRPVESEKKWWSPFMGCNPVTFSRYTNVCFNGCLRTIVMKFSIFALQHPDAEQMDTSPPMTFDFSSAGCIFP